MGKELGYDNERALFVDIDGVLADISHRLDFINGEQKNYDRFYGACMAQDKAIKHNIAWIAGLARQSGTLAFITGRPERTRELTRLWLKEYAIDILLRHFNNDPEHPSVNIFMRKDGDHRPSPQVKTELVRDAYSYHLENWTYNDQTTVMILDDDEDNLDFMSESLRGLEQAPRVITMKVDSTNA